MIIHGGFTLIELLVVIAIIAILSVVVILTLNPTELLKQSRDSTRVSDLSTLRTAIAQYLVDVSGATLAGTYNICYMSGSSTAAGATCGFAAGYYAAAAPSSSRVVTGAGWLPINFSSITSGAPISILPVDPLNTANSTNTYRYAASTSVFELNAVLESNKQNASSGAVQTDGGNSIAVFEAGTAAGLAL